ncbi:Ribosome production factor 2-like protein, partial [Fragariocoptes setiger]
MPNNWRKFTKLAEPALVEGDKTTLYIRGYTGNKLTTNVMKDIYSLQKPLSSFLNRKNVIIPFDDASTIEYLCQKNESPLFMFSAHSKKRPNNLVMGRTFGGQILDMIELGIDSYKSISEFKNLKISLGSKPVLVFAGEAFETEYDMIRIKNLLNDFFCGPKPTSIRVAGIEHTIQFIAHGGKIHMRVYLVEQKKTGSSSKSIVELTEMGPRLELSVRRTRIASFDHFKLACKQQPKVSKSKKTRNVSKDAFGATRGKLHMQRQALQSLHHVHSAPKRLLPVNE